MCFSRLGAGAWRQQQQPEAAGWGIGQPVVSELQRQLKKLRQQMQRQQPWPPSAATTHPGLPPPTVEQRQLLQQHQLATAGAAATARLPPHMTLSSDGRRNIYSWNPH